MSSPRGGWWLDVALVAGFIGLTAALAAGLFLDVDLAIRNWVDTHRPAPLWLLARVANVTGSANLLAPILLALATMVAVRVRTPRPVLAVLVTFAASYVVVVPLKILTDRAAPHSSKSHSVELFANELGWSYPSGHVVNALIWYPLLLVLLGHLLRHELSPAARWAIRVAPVVAVSVSVTYLGFHWLTDVAAGLLLGGVLDRVLRRLVRPA